MLLLTPERIRTLQRKLYIKAKQEPTYRFYALYDKLYQTDILHHAWALVKANKGSPGVDGMNFEVIESGIGVDHYLLELGRELQEKTYRASAVKRVMIPKADGNLRPLGIPTIRDRVVQMAVKIIIEPIFEADFCEHSYGFRPRKSAHQAIDAIVDGLHQGQTQVIDADLSKYFDSIPHSKLMATVAERIADGAVLALIKQWLKAPVMGESENGKTACVGGGKGNRKGTPQGGVISPLLANLYLHSLDKLMMQAGYTMVRYADDFVILCPTQKDAENALELARQWVNDKGLTLHPDKTHVGNSTEKGQGFDFLGYRFEAGKRWVRKKSLKALKDKIRSKTRRSRGDSMETIVKDLNPMLKGWFNYFKHAHKWTFSMIDGFIRRRLRSLRNKQSQGDQDLDEHTSYTNKCQTPTSLDMGFSL